MDSSLYPDGVVVESSDLQNTEDTKSRHIQQRGQDLSRTGSFSGGRVSGLVIGANSTAQITVSSGYGYTPRNDFTKLDAPVAVNLASYTSGTVNAVLLRYRELPSSPRAHESDGTRRNTQTAGYGEVVVMLKSVYDALTEGSTDLEEGMELDLAVDNKHLFVYVGEVTGNGSTAVVTGDIDQETLPEPILTARFAAAQTISGINIRSIGAQTPLGTGELTYDVSSNTLTWAKPGDTAGAPESTLVTSGELVSLDPNTAAPTGDNHSIVVQIFPEFLPAVDADDDIVVEDVYAAAGQAFSATDAAHRSKLGSSIPSVDNPHGVGPEDFQQQILDFLQLMRLGANYTSTPEHSILPRLSGLVHATARTAIVEFGPANTSAERIRAFYNPQLRRAEITLNADLTSASASNYLDDVWVKDTATKNAIMLAIGPAASGTFPANVTMYRQTDTGDASFADDEWTDEVLPIGGQIELGTLLTSVAADAILPRIVVPTATAATLSRTLLTDADMTYGRVRTYYYVGASTADYAFEFVSNAYFGTDSTWNRDQIAASYKLSIGAAGIELLHHPSGATWIDTISSGNWVQVFKVDATDGVTVGRSVTAGTGILTSTDYSTPRFRAPIAPTPSFHRWLVSETFITGDVYFRKYAVLTPSDVLTEETVNARWDGSSWTKDISGRPSSVTAMRTEGLKLLRMPASVSSWGEEDADWRSAGGSVSFVASAETLSFLQNGSIMFTNAQSGTGSTNPAIGDNMVNTLTAKNLVKAWAAFSLINIDPYVVAGLEGFNINSITPEVVADRGRVTVQFQSPIESYAVLITPEVTPDLDQAYSGVTGGSSDEDSTFFPWAIRAWADKRTSTGFAIYASAPTTAVEGTLLDLSGTLVTNPGNRGAIAAHKLNGFSFMVLGVQS